MTEKTGFIRVFAAACMGMLLFGVVIIILGSTLPVLISKFHLNELQAGTLTALLPFGILLGSLVFGPIVDRYSYKYLLIICTLIVVVGTEGIAYTGSFVILQLSVFVIGLGGGVINGGANALVADISRARPQKRSANLSLLGVFYGIGALGMPFLLGFLAESYSYHQILAVTGVIMTIPAVYFAMTRFPQPKQSKSLPLKKSLKLAADFNLILLGLFLFFQSGIEGVISNWVTLYLETNGGFSQSHALFALSFFVLSLTITRIFLVFLLNRFRPYLVLSVSIFIMLTGILMMMFSRLPSHEIMGLVLLGSGVAAGFPVILGYVGDLYSELSGTAFSLVFVIALTGNILINFLMGAISNILGIKVFSLMLLVCFLCLTAIFVQSINRIKNKTRI